MQSRPTTTHPRYRNEFDATMQLIQGKWKIMIMYEIAETGTSRFADLQHHIREVSHKTLTNQLKELADDDLIERHDFQTAQPHVEYTLTAKGQSIIPLLDAICDWGDTHIDHAQIERSLCDE
ncbi:MAG: helix-turn-helix transcriptional regulator [Furfurilactobacillus sp.]|uniref:Helix-turn-helix transcriptional regulator n=1 Tax=Furfurilactobacillus milii TaxID=2888272 RepID=A0ABT6DBL0_9LACO|nr:MULTISPECIES: helix-turn-helix domain-containing protein [Furfurilactobacillus]QLE67329.1 transcriptional regulator [Furfurilactobacillus rossiae]MCF6161590.1 helix-turn-helix transcriptional regulator [Furfurilactobacillus milii]MCF6163970.1 helix-turn-helix transcriptional regulator [Furfurilactobacillus milii]MCF6419384.1 helix-turn-helix transcriptional regulator [Furfurilactobacillus milii]MCH4011518.1 helix-turn-helix transcriptional regulator [Furfurilactobacillus sp.]